MVGSLAFAGVYAAATVAFVPGSLLTLGAGFIYARILGQLVGVIVSSVVVLVAATVGSVIAFLVARFVLRNAVC